MQLVKESKEELAFHWKDVTFHIRAVATAGDKHELTTRFADGIQKDGTYKASKADVYPWVIERFVTGWKGVTNGNGKEVPFSMDALLSLPSDPEADLMLVLGAHIVNHTGLAAVPAESPKKKD